MTASTLPKRVLTYLRNLNSSEPQLAKFGECVLASFSSSVGKSSHDEIQVNCKLVENRLILSQSSSSGTTGVSAGLDHSDGCPALEMDEKTRQELPTEILSRGVSTAVCVLLESSDQHILLTRRAKHMRTFPNVWVPPGGGIELGESLLETGLRELFEEVGLSLQKSDIVEEGPLCLWESVYPQTLKRGQFCKSLVWKVSNVIGFNFGNISTQRRTFLSGLPTRHHIVLYHHLRVHLDSQQLSSLIVLDPKETDAYMWVSWDMARTATGRNLPAKTSLTVFELGTGNVKKPISLLLTDLPESGSDVERISTGTKFALKHWIKMRP